MKIIFFGSDDFAAVHLESLVKSPHQIVACVTQPDRAKGRGMQVVFSPIKEIALRSKIPVLQPESLKDVSFIDSLRSYDADLFVVIAYGKILPSAVLSLPKLFAINVHGSLLPKYRGAAPINWAIINGEKESGLTIIKLNPHMDAGDILAQERIKIASEDTSVILRAKMMDFGPAFLLKTIQSIEKKTISLVSQNSKDVTLAPKLTKELGLIDWKKDAASIHNMIRGLLPWPSAYTFYHGKMFKILSSQVVELEKDSHPGKVCQIFKDGFVVSTGSKGLLVKQVHLESAKPMEAGQFVTGHKIGVGFQFG